MTLQLDVVTRNARLDAIETAAGTSPILRVRSGTKPANAATADSGTVLAALTLPSNWMADADTGSKEKAGTWEDLSADATGFAGHWRLYTSGDACRAQGPCGQAREESTAYVVGQRLVANGNVYVVTTSGTTAAGAGPTGTGTGITDGTAVVDYVESSVGVLLMSNTSLTATQAVTVTSWAFTEGNA